MKYEIETYKGHTIFYNDESDKFTCEMVIEDSYKQTSRKSLNDVRKEIDTFIKLNLEFKPFTILFKQYYNDAQPVLIDSIRSDGSFNCKQTRSIYEAEKILKNGFVYDEAIISIQKQIDQEESDCRKRVEELKKRIESKLVPLSADFLDKYKV